MRESGVGGLLIYCADYRCSTSLSNLRPKQRFDLSPVRGRTWICWRDYDETRVLSVGHAPSSIRRQSRLCSILLLPGWATTCAPDSCGTNGSPSVRLRCCQALDWKYVSVVRLAEHVSEPVCRIPCAAKPLLRKDGLSVAIRTHGASKKMAPARGYWGLGTVSVLHPDNSRRSNSFLVRID